MCLWAWGHETGPHKVSAATLTLFQLGGDRLYPPGHHILMSPPSFESHRRTWGLLNESSMHAMALCSQNWLKMRNLRNNWKDYHTTLDAHFFWLLLEKKNSTQVLILSRPDSSLAFFSSIPTLQRFCTNFPTLWLNFIKHAKKYTKYKEGNVLLLHKSKYDIFHLVH